MLLRRRLGRTRRTVEKGTQVIGCLLWLRTACAGLSLADYLRREDRRAVRTANLSIGRKVRLDLQLPPARGASDNTRRRSHAFPPVRETLVPGGHSPVQCTRRAQRGQALLGSVRSNRGFVTQTAVYLNMRIPLASARVPPDVVAGRRTLGGYAYFIRLRVLHPFAGRSNLRMFCSRPAL